MAGDESWKPQISRLQLEYGANLIYTQRSGGQTPDISLYTVHIAEKFACLQILYDCDPRRLMRWSLLAKPSDLFSTVGMDEKTVGEFDGLGIISSM